MKMKILGIAAAMMVSATASHAADMTLRYSSWLPIKHWLNTEIMDPWFAEIEAVTDGRVKIVTMPKSVGTPQSQFDIIRDGLADISFIVPGYQPGRFPLLDMGELPFFGVNESTVVAPAFYRVFSKYMEPLDQLGGVKVSSIWVNGPGHVFNSKHAITSVADFDGLKLRSTGSIPSQTLTELGAVPVLKPSTEAFEMMASGILDGGLSQSETLKASNMIDLVSYGTIVPGGLYHAPLAIIMNPAAWAKISDADKAAIDAISGEALAEKAGIAFDVADGNGYTAMEEQEGLEMSTASDAFVAELKIALAPVEAAWVEAAKEVGLEDPAAVLEEFRADIAARSSN